MTSTDALLIIVAGLAALVQATIGVGFALIVAPVAAIVRPDLLPGAVILLMIPLNAWVAWRERGHVDHHGVGWITGGRVVGAVIGLWILAVLSVRGLNLLIGASTILAVAASLLAPRFRPGKSAFVAAGLVTGVTETATGIGGPPLALVFQHQTPPALRANVALCFLIGEVMSVGLLLAVGSLSGAQVVTAGVGLPAVGLGIVLCGPARRRLDARMLRLCVLLFAVISALWIMLPHG